MSEISLVSRCDERWGMSLNHRRYLSLALWKKNLPPPLGNSCNFYKIYTALRFSEMFFFLTSHMLSIFEQSRRCSIDREDSYRSFICSLFLACVFLKILFLTCQVLKNVSSCSSYIFGASHVPREAGNDNVDHAARPVHGHRAAKSSHIFTATEVPSDRS